MNTFNTKTHSSKDIATFSFTKADVKSICYRKTDDEKQTVTFFLNYVETKLCKPCTSFTSHLHSSCGMVWYRTLRVKLTGLGAGIAQLVVLGLAVHSVAGSILLWGHFPVEAIFPLELTWVQTPFPQKLFRMRV